MSLRGTGALFLLATGLALGCRTARPHRPPALAPPVGLTFDPEHVLPLARATDLIPPDEDLLCQMESLASKTFSPRPDSDATSARLGDIVSAAAAVGFERQPVAQVLEQWSLTERERQQLLELCSRSKLTSPKWKPKRSSPDDGILMGPTLDRSAWSDWPGSTDLFQGAVLLLGTRAQIQAAERDFPHYREHVGAKYESIDAVPGSAEAGNLPDGRPFSAIRFAFVADLPFPFGSYSCVAQLFSRREANGRSVTDLWSDSPDFLWLASQDVYVPIETSAGDILGYILVRRHGFDLAGIPDGAKDRAKALRESMGNLARDVEL